MSPTATLLWFCVFILDTAGQLAFKAGATVESDETLLARWKALLSNKWILMGLFSYVFEFISWLAFLSFVPLSQGVLLSSVNIIAVMIGGRIFFGEALTRKRLVATGMIATGVALVGWG